MPATGFGLRALAVVLLGNALLWAGCGPWWRNRFGPSSQAEFNKVVSLCQREIKQQRQYLRQHSSNPRASSWDLGTCLQVYGWYPRQQ